MPRVTPLYYHFFNEPSICDAFDNTRVQYIIDTLHIIRSVFKTPIITLYQICKICVSFAVQYIWRIRGECLFISSLPGKALRTLVDIAGLDKRFNKRSQGRAWQT